MKKLIIMLLVTFSVVTADVWISEVVDAGENPSLALDSSDNPHIAYTSSDSLKYARWDGSVWQIETVDTDVLYSEFKLDSADMPHIAYLLSDDSLKYARWDGSAWQIETVDSRARKFSFQLDSVDNPCLAYTHYDTENVKYKYYNSSSWHLEEIETERRPKGVMLAFDSFDSPHVLYTYDRFYDFRMYTIAQQLRRDDSKWLLEFEMGLGKSDDWPAVNALVLDSSNYTHMLIENYNSFPLSLTYVYWDGTGWNRHKLLATSMDFLPSLVLDSLDYPYASYSDMSNLEYGYSYGSEWVYELVNIQDFYDSTSSLALDSLDKPHIAYGDGAIKYAYKGINTPPEGFSLLAPANGETVNDWPLCDWEDSTDSDGHNITYDLWYSTDDTFGTYDEISDLTESEYQFVAGELQNDSIYYWKVVATDSYDETWSTETWSFYVAGGVGVELVELASQPTDEGVLLSWSIVGDEPVSVSVLRGLTQNDTVDISGELSGSATSWLDVSAEAGVEYAYYLEVTELDGTVSRFGPSEVVVPVAVRELALSDPYPNPADESLTIHYELTQNATVKLHIYDVAGRLVETLVSGEQTAGRHSVNWDSSTSATGVYLIRLETSGEAITKRAVISQ